MRISKHAVDRYIERFPDWSQEPLPTRGEAEKAIARALETEPSDIITPEWLRRTRPAERGTEFVHLYNHCLVIVDNTVVTVLSKGCVTRLREKKGCKPIR